MDGGASNQFLAGMGVLGLVGAGLAASSLLHSHGVPNAKSRYAAPLLIGAALLVATVYLEPMVAVLMTAALAVGVVLLKVFRREALAGVSGDMPSQRWSEATFGVSSAASMAIGWAWLGDPWLGFLPAAFMAWGDGTAGFTRTTRWQADRSQIWPTLAMGIVCLAVAGLYPVYWIGVAGAVAATIAERKRPRWGVLWDDNVNVVAVSLLVMAVLSTVAG